MTAHSKIGASSMYRWSMCPGSVKASEGIESRSSKYAEEGTKAHDMAADFLEGKGVAADDEVMHEAVLEYGYFVRDHVDPGDTLLVEHQFDLTKIHAGCFGTADAVIWKPATKRLMVIDFKYGAGIQVEVTDNPQLMYYALGALVTCGFSPMTVEMVIVQPRCAHPDGPIRSQVIDAIDLLDFKTDLKDYALATEKPDAPLVPGSWCGFCPAAGTCPSLQNKAQAVAKMEFSPVLSYDPAKLKLALDSREVVKAWLKAVDEFAYAEAEAGRTPPGYKLVAKRATRKWRNEGDAMTALQGKGVATSAFMETAIKSPAQLEKLLGKGFIDELVVAESSGHTLAPESDKRPSVKPNAKEEFSVVEG